MWPRGQGTLFLWTLLLVPKILCPLHEPSHQGCHTLEDPQGLDLDGQARTMAALDIKKELRGSSGYLRRHWIL